MSGGPTTTEHRLLPEIEGLRALAVLTVLLYHAHLGFSGGYVGVDVFFVVSGFLITGLLLREFEQSGSISLREFYGRRARRLLPAAAVVLVVTLVLADRLLGPLRAHDNARDTLFAAGFIANFHFASSGADYFQQGGAPSLLQHWWSLAVEEQFYLLWPGLLALLWMLVGRHRSASRIRFSALGLTAVLGGASYVIGHRLTSSNPSWGYFATWSRAWELAVGAACAFLWPYRERVALHRLRSVLGWVGVALILYAALRLDDLTPFPGTAAWYPVIGTVLVIGSIGTYWGPGLVLNTAPLQWIGGRSYGLYLWHWPLLMLLEARVDEPAPLARAGVLVVSVLVAAASFVLLENPVRHLASLRRSPWRSIGLGVGLTGAVLVAGTVGIALSNRDAPSTGYVAPVLTTTGFRPTTAAPLPTTSGPRATPPEGSAPVSSTTLAPTTTAAPTAEDFAAELARRVSEELQPIIQASVENNLVPDNVRPPLRKVGQDRPVLFKNGCLGDYSATSNPACEYGDPTSSTSVVLFGDSHAAMWFPGLEMAAQRNGWKLTALTKSGCPSAKVAVIRFDKPTYPECDKWRMRTMKRIVESDADLVVMTNYRYRGSKGPLTNDVWRSALSATIEELLAGGKQVLILSDTPYPGINQSECALDHPRTLRRCNRPRKESIRAAFILIEEELAAKYGITAFDTTDWLCTDLCPAIIGDVAAHHDEDHLTKTYSEFLSPYLELAVLSALARQPQQTP